MSRSQSLRNHARASKAATSAVDDLGVLKEKKDTVEETLRRQLLEKERECHGLTMSIENYKTQLDQRPPLEAYQKLEREHKDLELLFQGSLRENEKCMAELERVKAKDKLLERELTRLAGDNWQENLEVSLPPSLPPVSSPNTLGGSNLLHRRSSTISKLMSRAPDTLPAPSPSHTHNQGTSDNVDPPNRSELEAQRLAEINQIRMMILGLDKRMDAREARLEATLDRAEGEGRRFNVKVLEAEKAGFSWVKIAL